MTEKSKILIIGATGYIGKFIVEASVNAGHPTFVLIREFTLSNPSKSSLIDSFKNAGVNIITGDMNDHESLITAIKQVDVVISAVGLGQTQLADQVKIVAAIKEAGNVKGDMNDHESLMKAIKQVDVVISAVGLGQTQLADQVKIIAAIKEAGNIKKFYPSEFGNDADRSHAVEPGKTVFTTKAQVRRAIEAENIPYTYVNSHCFAGYILPTLAQSGVTAPPRDKVVCLGDGNTKAVINEEHDIATYTIKTVDDPRTVNKSVYINPPGNIYSFNELMSLWEKKIGKTLEKVYLSEDQVLKNIEESPFPHNLSPSFLHAVFVKGDQTNFAIEPSFGLEASELYPDVKYTTVDEYLSRFV